MRTEGGREGGKEGGREKGREGGREGGRSTEGGMEVLKLVYYVYDKITHKSWQTE